MTNVKETLKRHHLVLSGDRILVGLSGGADSVCLIDCLLALSEELNISVSAAHVNHGLRGQDADEDEAFVRKFCQERKVSLFVHRADVRALAKDMKTGLEEAGRNVRYAFFRELQEKYGFHKIATAHHADDNVETVLMRLMRGTGPLGLGGILHCNGDVIRPLLDVSREDVEAYCKARNLSYRTDLSNYETNYTRNRIRHELIPYIEEQFIPSFRQSFQGQIELYAACGAYIKDEAEKLFQAEKKFVPEGFGFSCRSLLTHAEFLVGMMLYRLMQQLAGRQEISSHHVNAVMEILHKQKGAVSLPGNVVAEICHGNLYVRRIVPDCSYSYEWNPEVFISETGQTVTFVEVQEMPEKQRNDIIYLDMQKLAGKKLVIRSRKEGDVFYPLGMEGRKKLQDFFVDQKLPYFLRDQVPILTVDNEIAWVAGYRGDRRFTATKETSTILCVTLHKGEQI